MKTEIFQGSDPDFNTVLIFPASALEKYNRIAEILFIQLQLGEENFDDGYYTWKMNLSPADMTWLITELKQMDLVATRGHGYSENIIPGPASN